MTLELARQLQILVLAMILLGAAAAKLARVLRAGSLSAGLGPTELFPARLRRPAALILCAAEATLGALLLLSAGSSDPAGRADATATRLATAILFLVAMCALVELRGRRPDVGCGCFGNLSTRPVGARSIVRAGLLAGAALATVGVGPARLPAPGPQALRDLGFVVAEFLLIAVLSPEVGEALVRLGYAEPCELRQLPAERALAALRRSSHWRRHSREITSDHPVDVWRELCWWYAAYPARRGAGEARVVFAIQVKKHRPAVQSAVLVRQAADADARPDASVAARAAGAGLPVPAPRETASRVRDDTGPLPSVTL
jgi:Methylamine utilisation protein MauE